MTPTPAALREARLWADAIRHHDRRHGGMPPDMLAWADRAERLLMAAEARRRYALSRRAW